MPIRPEHLATMSASLAGARIGRNTGDGPTRTVAVVFESGHRQELEEGGCRMLDAGQGGVVSLEADAGTRFALYSGTSCQGARAIATGTGSASFGTPVFAGAVVLG
ncbi:hypothetical protein [Nocardiopsis potens]|uniref:hypothetical protein n=1 Tax=Nocardiopsis potens TaxID=1246458 RepID=UPI00037E8503|nr:hypothetical protein [Nocardiopsis potens]